MVNEEHIAILKQGVKVWNRWRKKNPETTPNFQNANFSQANFSGSNFREASLYGDFRQADFTNANFKESDFKQADLSKVNLSEAEFQECDMYWSNFGDPDYREEYLGLKDFQTTLSYVADFSGANFRGANFRDVIFSGNFRQANFTNVDFTLACFRRADLREAIFHRAIFSEIYFEDTNFFGANFSKANLHKLELTGLHLHTINLCDTDLSKKDISGTYLNEAELSGVNLKDADLTEVNVNGANLQCATLTGTNLTRIQALGTNFNNANLTEACIEDWNINSTTNLDGVICDYIYLRQGQQERRPSNGNFVPGEFTKLYQKSLETVDFIFRNGIDWDAFAYSFKKVEVENQGAQLDVQSIEKKGDSILLVRISVSPDTDKPKIHSDFMQGYEFAHKALDAQYQARIDDKDKEINRLFYLLNQASNNPKKISNYYQQNSQFAGGIVDAETVHSHQIGGDIYNTDNQQHPD